VSGAGHPVAPASRDAAGSPWRQAHRYDYATPLEETMQAFADVVRSGKALYIGVSEWRAEELRAAKALDADVKARIDPALTRSPERRR
jgi:aryl-alcohol dehydrogenase-like predicted oxidoreductase